MSPVFFDPFEIHHNARSYNSIIIQGTIIVYEHKGPMLLTNRRQLEQDLAKYYCEPERS